jgi:casein kinase 1
MSHASSGSRSKVPPNIDHGRYEISKKLGAGCFGEVYRGQNTATKEEVAVKFEDIATGAPQLEHEATMLNLLRQPVQPQGFAQYFYFGKEGQYHCMVMEYLGKSLEDRVQACGGRFSVKTTVLVAEQILRRIEYLHSKGIVHRDIKPENFMWGIKEKQHHLYLIDFGLSKRYFDKKHAQLKQKLSLTGTARYASLNAHRGIEQSRRDDLEAIGHMLLYFLRGSLPWSGLEARSKQEKYRKIKEKKESTPLHDLCSGFPEAFEHYLHYCRQLGFKDRPDYNMLRKLFRETREQLEKEERRQFEDWELEWNASKGPDQMSNLVPLTQPTNLLQPDDTEARSRSRRFLCCFGSGAAD